MNHQRKELTEAIRPTAFEVTLAADAITAAIGRGVIATTDLHDLVQERFASEPLPDPSRFEGVQAVDLRTGKAIGATALALAHLEAAGSVLPYGGRRVHGWQMARVPYSHQGTGSTYSLDPFNFELADNYVLPLSGLGPDIEAPVVFLQRLPSRMANKARRVLTEAVNAYAAGQFVATALLIGTASEAGWEHVATVAAAKTNDKKLTELLSDPFSSAAQVQGRAIEVIAPLKVTTKVTLAYLDSTARAYRDLRNHAVHEPEGSFDEPLFARSVVGTLLIGSLKYFGRLYEVLESLAALTDAAGPVNPAKDDDPGTSSRIT